MEVKPAPRVLTIAGSDSGGGAGIQADLKTCQELGVFGMSAITAVTAQNSLGVHAVYPLEPAAVQAQIDAVLGDIGADAVKTGMLLDPAIVMTVAESVDRHRIRRLVIDPVLHAKDGSALLRREAVRQLRELLFPKALIITPNVPEACELLGLSEQSVASVADMAEAAYELLKLGPQYVLLKGGHLDGTEGEREAVDVLAGGREHADSPLLLRERRIASRHTHGTGCTTASAIAAHLALGCTVPQAVKGAKQFVTQAIQKAVPLGRGTGSLWHAAHRYAREK